ncbi:MAG: Gfo/Idh/MocA family oxidoreductase, partial [Planctomycetes bacterium]|nr:Gfo/Idh/MocA family oxidoreductase [Planctomycetota bacterium]
MYNGRSTRRKFFQQSGGVVTAATLASAISSRAYAAEDNTIAIALVGCGGRGSGAAAQALKTKGPTKLVAMADAFADRLGVSLRSLGKRLADKVDVPPERQFIGLDAYRKAIDAVAPGGVVILATPPAFRPIHLEYAVAKGCHVFMEKSFAVDVPGVRRVLKAGEEAAKKNLKIAGGLMCRHNRLVEE